ncbi:MAG: InlB B-repeat-containing protein [Clostridiales bacterium]|nr:InlB B-repeat-containing protein [Clostridiales bacterium]
MRKFTLMTFAVFAVIILTGCPGTGQDTMTYTVTYDDNGSDSGAVPTDSTVYTEDSTVTVSGNTGSLEKTQDGITLLFSWNTLADGNGSDYDLGSGTFSMGSSDITLYANWTAIGCTGPGGGLIFYIDEVNAFGSWDYLEAAPSDQSSNQVWSNIVNDYANGTSVLPDEIGAGSANTYAITSQTGHTTSAALICVNYAGGGEVDWFLPSRDELTEMYNNLESIGGFSDDIYWSSSESSQTLARCRTFSEAGDYEHTYVKSNNFIVRAIRAF